MFVAVDKDGNKVAIADAEAGKEYFCPVCKSPVSVRAQRSESVTAHFAHKRGVKCLDDWKHDMSEWHCQWQERFPVECRECVVEHNGERHRADVLFRGFVFEFQHSPISCEEFTKRNQFYLNCGYRVIWIFDATEKIKSIDEIVNPKEFFPCSDGSSNRFVNLLCRFRWKRKRSEFASFYDNYVFVERLSILLDIAYEPINNHLIIPLAEVDSESPIAWFFDPPLTVKNILKTYGVIDDTEVLSFEEVKEKQKVPTQQGSRTSLHPNQLPSRKTHGKSFRF